MSLTFENNNVFFTTINRFMAKHIRGNHMLLVSFFCVFLFYIVRAIQMAGFKYQTQEKKRRKIEKLKNRVLERNWLNLIHLDEAECELNCKPIGMNYFATLRDRVIDGTSCLFPVDFVRQNHSGRAMCVDGICKVSSIRFYRFWYTEIVSSCFLPSSS